MVFSVDFSKNYENKQKNEIQSAYLGHEAFTLNTATCYIKNELPGAKCDPDCDLYM